MYPNKEMVSERNKMRQIMGYHLKQFIGVGTFAEIWHAERVDKEGIPCASDVALKIGLCHLDDRRIERERAVLYQTAPLQHEGMIKILDIMSRDDTLVIAMELAENSLLGMLRAGISVVECLRYVEEAALTLDDFHKRQIVHGGINPTDILVRGGHAKLADFGPLPDELSKSRVPYYKRVCMAPELRQGHGTPASDQYSLAATYAWLRLRSGAFAIPRRGELPSEIDIEQLPQREKQVLLMALNQDPTDRFATCSIFVEALKQVQ
jgi:eukaryotic-like serine/threonine-protein kinase